MVTDDEDADDKENSACDFTDDCDVESSQLVQVFVLNLGVNACRDGQKDIEKDVDDENDCPVTTTLGINQCLILLLREKKLRVECHFKVLACENPMCQRTQGLSHRLKLVHNDSAFCSL